MEKILTIVIPTYNMQDYLRRCLDSLIVPEEQMKQLEVLVVNDGSKDNSSAIAHEYQDKYPDTFRVIDKENGNYGSCVNRGLKEATGKYIKILDADDWFDNENFIAYLNYLVFQNVDVVLNDCQKVNNLGENCGSFLIIGLEENKEYPLSILYEKNIYPQMHCVAYRLDLLKEMGYHQTEGISYTDQEWVLKPMANVETIIYLKTSLYNYMLGREGQTMEKEVMERKFCDHVDVIFSIIGFIHTYKFTRDINFIYLQSKTRGFLNYIYHIHLVDNVFNHMSFQEFDTSLQTNYPKFYNLFISRDRLVRYWYKKNINLTSKLLFSFYLAYLRFRKHKLSYIKLYCK